MHMTSKAGRHKGVLSVSGLGVEIGYGLDSFKLLYVSSASFVLLQGKCVSLQLPVGP